LKGETNSLIDSMWRDFELGRNLFGRKVLVDERQTVELPSGELRNSLGHFLISVARILWPRRHIHEHISEQTVPNTAGM